jgi:hypothetical protein
MADSTDSGMSGAGQTGPPSGGSSNPPSAPNSANNPDPNELLNRLLAGMEKLTAVYNSIDKVTAKISESNVTQAKAIGDATKNVKAMGTSLKTNVDMMEDITDLWKETSKQTEKFIKDSQNIKKSRQQTIEEVQKLIKQNEQLIGSQKLYGYQVAHSRDSLRLLRGVYKDIKAQSDSTFDHKKLSPFADELKKIHTHTKALGIEFKKIQPSLHGIGTRHQNIRAAFSDAGFYMKQGLPDKLGKLAQLAANMRELKEAHHKNDREEFHAKRAKLGLGLGGHLPRKANGETDWKEFARPKDKSTTFWALHDHKTTAKKLGTGWLGERALQALATSKAGGTPLNSFNRGILSLMERGGGSVPRGVGSWGMGLAERGIGMGAEALAIPGVAEVGLLLGGLKELFDHQIHINQGIEKNLGAAGVFTGGESTFRNLSNVQTNLMPSFRGGFYNSLGISYKKNMEIAQAMASSGVGLSELQENNGMFPGSRQWGPGAYGAIQHTAYTTARVAGFDTAGGVAQQIKLIQSYGQSLTATHEFFITLNKDAKAAGMTTVKYVSIIDDVTSGLDRMNKSFSEAVNIIRVLGRTGGSTAEDIKDYIGAITGEGVKRTVATNTFLLDQMPKEARQSMARASQNQTRDLADMLAQSVHEAQVTGAGFDNLTGQTLANKSVAELYNLQGNLGRAGGPHNAARADLDQQIGQYIRSRVRTEGIQNFAEGRGTALGTANMLEFTGSDLNTQAMMQNAAVNTAMQQGFSANSILSGQAFSGERGPLLKGLLEQFNVKPEDIMPLLMTHAKTAGMVVDKINNLATTGTTREALNYAQNYAGLLGKGGTAAGVMQMAKAHPDQLQTLLMNSSKIGEEIWKQDKDIVTKSQDQLAETKATQLSIATRPTADIFADAFEHLFMLIVKPINAILDVLPWKANSPTDLQRQTYDNAMKRREEAQGNLEKIIRNTSGKYTPDQIAKAKEQLAYLQAPIDEQNATAEEMSRKTSALNFGAGMGTDITDAQGNLLERSKVGFDAASLGLGVGASTASMEVAYRNAVDREIENWKKSKSPAIADKDQMLSLVDAAGNDIALNKQNQLMVPEELLHDSKGGYTDLAMKLDEEAKEGFLDYGMKDWAANTKTDQGTGKSVVYITVSNSHTHNNTPNFYQGIAQHNLTRSSSDVVKQTAPALPSNPVSSPRSVGSLPSIDLNKLSQ